MKKIVVILVLLLFIFSPLFSQQKEAINIYKDGEELNYNIYYSVIGIYFNAGNAQFSLKSDQYQEQDVHHITALGWSNSSYDWIFKVRDKYESYVQKSSLLPVFFNRRIEEGKYKKTEQIRFLIDSSKAISNKGEYPIPEATQDVLSAIYFARNINFNNYKSGDKIYFNLFLDNELFKAHITYLGKEKIKTKLGSFNTIKFKPLLLKGTIFKSGDGMSVWVTDDRNHIPLKIVSEISVGSIRCEIASIKNNAYPLSSITE